MKLLLLFLCGGCVSFQAVHATAELGTRVGTYEHALDPLGTWCRLSAATATQPENECDRLDEDARTLRRIPIDLAAWSQALRRMAEDAPAPGLGGDAATFLAPLTKHSGAVGAALDALFRLSTGAYRRTALAHAFKQAAPEVQLLVQHARGEVALARERLDALIEQQHQIARALPGQAPPEVAERQALVAVSAWLSQARDSLAEYDRALQAFAAAHAKLAAAADRLSSDDPKVYLAIVDEVKRVYEGVKK
jgi:hypothetical protein